MNGPAWRQFHSALVNSSSDAAEMEFVVDGGDGIAEEMADGRWQMG
jgi:hypothetical protein